MSVFMSESRYFQHIPKHESTEISHHNLQKEREKYSISRPNIQENCRIKFRQSSPQGPLLGRLACCLVFFVYILIWFRLSEQILLGSSSSWTIFSSYCSWCALFGVYFYTFTGIIGSREYIEERKDWAEGVHPSSCQMSICLHQNACDLSQSYWNAEVGTRNFFLSQQSQFRN